MAHENDGALFRQPLSNAGTLEVRAGHFVAKRQQHLGNAAHADAANPDEMYPLNFCKHFSGRFATNRLRVFLAAWFSLLLLLAARRASRARGFYQAFSSTECRALTDFQVSAILAIMAILAI